jgi:hypothetical protein
MDEVERLIEVLMKMSKYGPLAKSQSPMRNPFRGSDPDEDLVKSTTELLIKIGSCVIPTLINKYDSMDYFAQVEARLILKIIFNNCNTINELRDFESKLIEGYEKIYERMKDGSLQKIRISIAGLKIAASKKRNELTKDKGILLDDKPKPPKGRMYQQLRRVRNG